MCAPRPLTSHQCVSVDGRLKEHGGHENHPCASPSAVLPHFGDIPLKAVLVIERGHHVERAFECIAHADVTYDCRS